MHIVEVVPVDALFANHKLPIIHIHIDVTGFGLK